MRRSLTGAVLTAALLIPASAAQASFVYLNSSSPYRVPPRSNLTFFADEGETNNLTVTNGANGALVLTDPGSTIETFGSSGCEIDGTGHVATCTPAEATPPLLQVNLEDGDDSFTDAASIPSETGVTQCYFQSCTESSPTEVFDVITTVYVSGDDGNDTLTGNDNSESFYAGFGNDTVRANGGDDYIQDVDQADESPADREPGAGDDHFFGGAGSDYLSGGDGNDELRGEDGDDFLAGDLGSDVIDGGGGFDGVGYFELYRYNADGSRINVKPTDAGATVNLDANAPTTGNGIDGENDTLAGIEDVDGSFASDVLNGSTVSNVLYGNGGNDLITGGAGNDNLQGGGGADTINAQDGEVDAVDCGGGISTDRAAVDNIDSVRNCGSATLATNVVPAPAGPVIIRDPADTVKAKLTKLKAAKKVKAKKIRKNGKYTASFTPNEPGKAEGELESKAGKKALRSTVGYVSLAKKARTATANKKVTLKLKIKKSLRRQLKKREKLRLTIRFTDAGGNVTTRKVNIKLT